MASLQTILPKQNEDNEGKIEHMYYNVQYHKAVFDALEGFNKYCSAKNQLKNQHDNRA